MVTYNRQGAEALNGNSTGVRVCDWWKSSATQGFDIASKLHGILSVVTFEDDDSVGVRAAPAQSAPLLEAVRLLVHCVGITVSEKSGPLI